MEEKEEKLFLEENGVMITNARYVYWLKKNRQQTQAMSGINSVSSMTTYGGYVMAVLFAFFACMFIYGGLYKVGLGLLVLAVAVAFLFKPIHYVVITQASGVHRGYRSKNRDFINRIITALNDAIVSRG